MIDPSELVNLVKRRRELESQICKRVSAGGRCGTLIDWLDDARAAEGEWLAEWDAHEAVRGEKREVRIHTKKDGWSNAVPVADPQPEPEG